MITLTITIQESPDGEVITHFHSEDLNATKDEIFTDEFIRRLLIRANNIYIKEIESDTGTGTAE